MRLGSRVSGLYYGWWMVLALSLSATISYGILVYSFTVFIAPMQAELGWSVAMLTGAFSVGLLTAGLVALPVGRWLDASGARPLMSVGSIAAVLLLVAWSQVNSPVLFYLIWLGIGAAMACVLYEPAFSVLAVWFNRDRGKALTVLTFLGGFASVLFIPLAGVLVETYGWRTAILVLAGVELLTLPLHALVLRRHPGDLGLHPGGVESAPSVARRHRPPAAGQELMDAAERPAFRLLTTAFSLSTFVVAAQGVHLVPLLVSAGHAPTAAAAVGGIIGLAALPGRLVLTPLGDVLPRRFVTAGIFLAQSLAFLFLAAGASHPVALWTFVVLYGAGFGATVPARAALLADYYGGPRFARLNARMTLLNSLARAFAPLATGLLVTAAAGSYTPLVITLAVLAALAAITVARAEQPPISSPNPV